MAKIVIVLGEHPTEVVAAFHARKVAKILREKYGHDVIVEKVPLEETNYGIVRKVPVGKGKLSASEAKKAVIKLISLKDSPGLTESALARHCADLCFNTVWPRNPLRLGSG